MPRQKIGTQYWLIIMHSEYNKNEPYVTRDGSLIRELMHPDKHGNAAQSLAEAMVGPGECTQPHYHKISEELYHITAGSGEMLLGDDTFPIRSGDTVCIRPGVVHSVRNTGTDVLHILCCCAPAYSHDDTVLMETGDEAPPQ